MVAHLPAMLEIMEDLGLILIQGKERGVGRGKSLTLSKAKSLAHGTL